MAAGDTERSMGRCQQQPCPGCVPLARTHYRVTFRAAAIHAKSVLWIETNYVVIFYVTH